MPKKTKRQKILANLHRKLQYSTTVQLQDLKLNPNSVKSQNDPSAIRSPLSYIASTNYTKGTAPKPKYLNIDLSNSYVVKDLIRITIFTAFALASQGVLYFLLRTR